MCEAADAPADYTGLSLNTASNGLGVLRTLDVDVAGQADGVRIPRTVLWSGTGGTSVRSPTASGCRTAPSAWPSDAARPPAR